MSHNRLQAHEFLAEFVFDEHDASPYWALRRILNKFDGGKTGIETTIYGKDWTLSIGYQKSGLAPRPSDEVEILYEIRVSAQGPGRKNIPLLIRPRWPNMKKADSGEEASIPHPDDAGEAVAVKVERGTNVDVLDYPRVIPSILRGLAQECESDWNFDYLSKPHPESRVVELELYARILQQYGTKLTDTDGIFHRLFHLAANVKGSKVVYSNDNRERERWNHQLRLDRRSMRELFSSEDRCGCQIKQYYPAHPEKFDSDDPLAHPKVGILFKKRLNKRMAVPWREVEDLLFELEETLMNVLAWGKIPVDPGPSFVADDHFTVEPSERQIAWFSDPTPAIEARQESLLVRKFQELSEAHIEILGEALQADGGVATTHELADGSGRGLSTVYRALERANELLQIDNGNVRFASEKLRQDLHDILDPLEQQVDAAAHATAHVLHLDPEQLKRKGSAWQKWLNTYAVERVTGDSDIRLKVRATIARYKSGELPYVNNVLEEGRRAWVEASRDRVCPWDEVILKIQEPNGEWTTGRVRTLRRSDRAGAMTLG